MVYLSYINIATTTIRLLRKSPTIPCSNQHTDNILTNLRQWNHEMQVLTAKHPGTYLHDALNNLQDDPNQWPTQLSSITLIPHLQTKIAYARSCIHYRQRRELRRHISKTHSQIEQSIEEGRLGKVIRRFCPAPAQDFTMQSIQQEDTTITTSPSEINHTLTSWFHRWHAPHDNNNLPFNSPTVDWLRIFFFFSQTTLINYYSYNIQTLV